MNSTADMRAGRTEESVELQIRANGEARSVPRGTTVAEFLSAHELEPDLVVVERNGRILRREEFDSTELETGDELEIVHFVGGG